MKLKVQVYNEKKEMTFCKINLCKLQNNSDNTVESNKVSVYCNGEYEFELVSGEYDIEFYKGNLFIPVKEKVGIYGDVIIEVCLKELIDTKSLGLYSFDAHSHVSRNKKSTIGNLEHASTIMQGEDFNFLFAGSPYDRETHIQDTDNSSVEMVPYRVKYSDIIQAVNNNSFILDIGNEIVKCRYGHMFLMNYDQMPPYSQYYDRAWDPWLFTKVGEEPEYDIAYPYEALGKERGPNSVAVAAHPTSWWHHNGEFISNIAATLGFEILAESIDAMVIMGYDSDHTSYQQLWYDVLNKGYFMPGVAESDHTFDTTLMKHLKFKTYTYVDSISIDSLCTSVKAGRNTVSSGPIILFHVNDHKQGAVLSYEEEDEFNIEIEAFQCYQALLSKIQIIVNGKVWIEHGINDSRYVMKEKLKFNQDSYVLAKCYDFAGNVAITNPVYIRNTPFENRNFKSDLTLRVLKDGKPANGLFWIDDNLNKSNFSKEINCMIKVASEVNIEVAGIVKKVKLFEMDELQQIFKNLYFGYFNQDKQYAPGEVPASYFELARMKKILSKVDLQISF
ncbi:CehA/McbA family metallohydrolase [Paenibacillus qinlingensis]|uniref:CehA/McbA family metallohydrolase n=1 Tax=Paenibacillus qinlingensis TaxID=1837343 RepID=UPI0015654ACF|nr:CehA/McbA family metallohydrolase [Paenibacillus qinlingensis]NQX59949.1 CehA/McbA family metallohydrolase [Paenibacillus qinlingensis]